MSEEAPPPMRPLWQEVLLVVAPVVATEIMGALRDRWKHHYERPALPPGQSEPSGGGA